MFIASCVRKLLKEISNHNLTTARNPDNFKVVCQRQRSQDRIFGFSTIAG